MQILPSAVLLILHHRGLNLVVKSYFQFVVVTCAVLTHAHTVLSYSVCLTVVDIVLTKLSFRNYRQFESTHSILYSHKHSLACCIMHTPTYTDVLAQCTDTFSPYVIAGIGWDCHPYMNTCTACVLYSRTEG